MVAMPRCSRLTGGLAGKAVMMTPTLMISSAKPHQPMKLLSRSRAQVNNSMPPSTAVTVMFTADMVCMSSCMSLRSDPECRLGAQPMLGAVTTSFTPRAQIQ